MKIVNNNNSKTMNAPIINCQLSIINLKRFFLLFLFLPAVYLASGQMPGMPYGVLSLDCSAAPGTPENISIPTKVPTGTTFEASITEVDGATKYTWNTPEGLRITAGQGRTSIECKVDAQAGETIASGTITVYASNDCGDGIAKASSNSITVVIPCTGYVLGDLCIASKDHGEPGFAYSSDANLCTGFVEDGAAWQTPSCAVLSRLSDVRIELGMTYGKYWTDAAGWQGYRDWWSYDSSSCAGSASGFCALRCVRPF
jgi:hypothetical protein